jgi:internalin A
MSDLAKRVIHESLQSKSKILDLGKLGLDGSESILNDLDQCDYVEVLILSNEWWNSKESRWQKSINYQEFNHLKQIPKYLPKNLKTLILSGDYFSLWEIKNLEALANLQKLKVLNLGYNQIEDISLLSNLLNIEILDLRFNQIKDVTLLKKLNNLESLNLINNRLEEISLQDFKNLTELRLQGNPLHTISLKNLPSLVNLDLFELKLTNVDLDDLPHLESLDLSSNSIEDYAFLKKILHLKSINLSKSQINDYTFLQNIIGLESLDLSYNRTDDYSFLRNLSNLKTIILSNCDIQSISFLEDLTQLLSINLKNNQIKDVTLLKKLNNLESLNLINNRLEEISLQDFKNLTELRLQGNPLHTISLKNLPSLVNLDLSRMGIKKIEFERLTALSSLDLSNNQIQDFSSKILESLPSLEKLLLFNNPIHRIPFDIVNAHDNILKAIKDHFNAITKGTIENDEIKMILIGNSTVGKTTMAKYLKENQYEKLQNTTHGIEVTTWTLSSNKNLKVHIWDFGGQEYYHATHRLFLSHNTVYCLLWNTKTNKQALVDEILFVDGKKFKVKLEHYPLEYWLKNIRYYSQLNKFEASSPILMIQSQKEEKKAIPINYFERYSVKEDAVFEVCIDSLNSYNTEQKIELEEWKDNYDRFYKYLVKTLEKTAAHYILGRYWGEIRDRIREASELEDRWSWNEYEKFCREIDPDIEIETLTNYYLSNIGILLYYPNHPRLKKTVYIRPSWVTDWIYKILDKSVLANNGEFNREHVYKITGKNHDLTDELIDLMKEFELIFSPQDQPNLYIAPQYLPDEYQSSEKYRLERIADSYKTAFVLFYPEFLPRSVFLRFIAEYGGSTNKADFWKQGLIFSKNKTEVFVRCVFEERKIEVKFQQDNPELAYIIFTSLMRINDNYYGTQVSIDGENFINYEKLKELIESNATSIRSEQGNIAPISKFKFLLNISTLEKKKAEVKKKQKNSILYIHSQPRDKNPLNYGREYDFIQRQLNSSKKRDSYESPRIEPVLKKQDFVSTIIKYKPSILHISVHASSSKSQMFFEDNNGNPAPVTINNFVDYFKVISQEYKIDICFINACNSANFGKSIIPYVKYVIATNDLVPDEIALIYTDKFYELLFNGSKIEVAHKCACIAITESYIDYSTQTSREDLFILLNDSYANNY